MQQNQMTHRGIYRNRTDAGPVSRACHAPTGHAAEAEPKALPLTGKRSRDPSNDASNAIPRTFTIGSYRWRSVCAVAVGDERDALLVARIRAGDDSALAAIYDEHCDVVYGIARRVTRDEHLARDVTQEVFSYLGELPDRVDSSRGSLRGYLGVLAHRRAVDQVRRSERLARTEASAAVAETVAGPEDGVVEDAAHAWRRQRLTAAMAGLSAEQRQALTLAYYDGLTYRSVARRLDIPEGTVKSRLRSAMIQLRKLLGDDVRMAI
jgi:RNA polymerase sigma-70 factor (ECF subfamily)